MHLQEIEKHLDDGWKPSSVRNQAPAKAQQSTTTDGKDILSSVQRKLEEWLNTGSKSRIKRNAKAVFFANREAWNAVGVSVEGEVVILHYEVGEDGSIRQPGWVDIHDDVEVAKLLRTFSRYCRTLTDGYTLRDGDDELPLDPWTKSKVYKLSDVLSM